MQINPDIFKAYDIRGLYPGEINEQIARQIGLSERVFHVKLRKYGIQAMPN